MPTRLPITRTTHYAFPSHTTGFGEVSGFADVLENLHESCRSPRRGHPDDGMKGSAVGEMQCLACHNPDKSPKFDYRPYLAKVRCPAYR